MALLVDVEGIDGSGKGTQAARLHERLTSSGSRSALLSFPRYDATLFGKAVGDFLNGRFGRLDEVDPFLVSLLYAGDRFESRSLLGKALDANDVVILDRYVASNIAHQGAKLAVAGRAELVDWIDRIEHGIFELPRPDLVLLLDLPAVVAQRLIAGKSDRVYTKQKADLQEADVEYLERVREVYHDLAAGDSIWHTIQCAQSGQVRSIADVADEIWGILQARLGN